MIDLNKLKNIYTKVKNQARDLRGCPGEYSVITQMCPVNAVEMQAGRILDLIERLEAAEKRVAQAEARVKEQQEKYKVEIDRVNERCKLLLDAKNHWADRARAAEAELARLKAQAESPDRQKLRDLVDVVWSDAAETPVYLSIEWADRLINQVFSSAAEPRPAVLPPEMVAVMERLNKGYFARWVKDYENPLEPEGFVGGSVRVSDLVKLFNFVLGCKPQRFVVKLPSTKCIGWVKEAVQEHDAHWIEAIKSAGGEIAE